ncbi:MAG: LacI family DNA-binding transcriptional regulator [Anaerolineales bacterium]|jgi:LacI family transcriptional regulator
MSSGQTPTIYDVAELAGLSIATVSRVMNSPESVAEKNRDKVLAAIEELGFIPRADARERARKQIGRIGVITPFFTLPSFMQRLRGIAEALVESQYELTIYPVDSLERLAGYFTVLPLRRQLDGLIALSIPVKDRSLKQLQQSHIPTVFIENHVKGFASIEIDNRYGGRLVAEYLISKGHQRFAYVGDHVVPEYTLTPETARLEGYRQALNEQGIDLQGEYIKLPAFPPRDPDRQVHELLDLEAPPTAIFAATDDLALRVLKVARKRGLSVPADLAIVGFDDIDIADYLDLTTVNQSLDESGKLAVEQLIAQIAEPSRPIQNTFVELKLIERGTT